MLSSFPETTSGLCEIDVTHTTVGTWTGHLSTNSIIFLIQTRQTLYGCILWNRVSALSLRQRCRPSPWMSDSSPSWPLVQRSTFGILAFRWLSRQPLPAENTSSSSSATVGVWLAPQLCGVRQTRTTLLKAHPSANAQMPLRSTTSFAARCLNAPALSRPKAVTSAMPKRKSTSTPCGWSNNHSHESPCGSFFSCSFCISRKNQRETSGTLDHCGLNRRPGCSFDFERTKEISFCFRQKETKNRLLFAFEKKQKK